MKKSLLLLVAIMMAFSLAATADVTFWMGTASSSELDMTNNMTMGGSLGFTVFKYFGFEVNADYIGDAQTPFGLSEFEELLGLEFETKVLFLSGNVVLQYPIEPYHITPYVTFGYGVFGLELNLVDTDLGATGGSTATNIGFGAKFNFWRWLAVRAEYRNYMINWVLEDDTLDTVIGDIEAPSFSRLMFGVAVTF